MTDNSTILEAFAPPDGLVGQTVLLCAMSASEPYLTAVLETFTGQTSRQRKADGRLSAFLFLDGRESRIPTSSIPGLYEFWREPAAGSELLHAKLAVLAFGPSRVGKPSKIRVIIPTGNWTEATARRQLELVWTCDVTPNSSPEDRADLGAACKFVEDALFSRFAIKEVMPRLPEFKALLDAAREWGHTNRVSRVFYSGPNAALFDGFKKRVNHDTFVSRNFLLCGSGFFEQGEDGETPEVLTRLSGLPCLTETGARYVVAQPEMAGALAAWAQKGDIGNWQIRLPIDCQSVEADRQPRSLHAKYVLIGYRRDEVVTGGKLYIGSGNLSKAGFLLTTTNGGNIEIGVISEIDRLTQADLADRLACSDVSPNPEDLSAGNGDGAGTRSGEPIPTPPLLVGACHLPDRTALLFWRAASNEEKIEVLWDGTIEQSIPGGAISCSIPDGVAPKSIAVRTLSLDGSMQMYEIPLWDREGRFCWLPPTPMGFSSALDELLCYPTAASDSEDPVPTPDDPPPPGGTPTIATPSSDTRRNDQSGERKYPLHTAMELVEAIAERQTSLAEYEVSDWIEHLANRLPHLFESQQVALWQSLGHDFLSVLLKDGFSPRFRLEKDKARYTEIIDTVSRGWGIKQ